MSATTETRALTNPFTSTSIESFLFEIVNVVLIMAVPIIVFYIIWSGFKYVMAQGNPEEVKSASRSLLYGLIGAVIIIGAHAIMAMVRATISAF